MSKEQANTPDEQTKATAGQPKADGGQTEAHEPTKKVFSLRKRLKLRKELRYSSKEDNFIHEVWSKLSDGSAKDLFIFLCGWYMLRSRKSKRQYYALTIFAYIFSGLVPLLTTIKGFVCGVNLFEIVVAFLSFLTSLCNFLLNIGRCSENWIRFRGCTESLKAEVFRFNSGIDKYKKLDNDKRQQQFIARMLEITGSEKDLWMAEAKDKGKNRDSNCGES